MTKLNAKSNTKKFNFSKICGIHPKLAPSVKQFCKQTII